MEIALHFYRAMHYSAKRGIAIACRLSVCNVGELGPHTQLGADVQRTLHLGCILVRLLRTFSVRSENVISERSQA